MCTAKYDGGFGEGAQPLFQNPFLCREATRPCTPGSISYREEMDERRAKNLLVFGFPAKGVKYDPL